MKTDVFFLFAAIVARTDDDDDDDCGKDMRYMYQALRSFSILLATHTHTHTHRHTIKILLTTVAVQQNDVVLADICA